jgi:hypothetical protein
VSITVKRLASSNEKVDLRDPQATVPYIAFRSNDEAAVRAAVNAASDATYYGLSKVTIDLTEEGGGVWTANVQYKLKEGSTVPGQSGEDPPADPPAPPGETDALDETYSFKTSGGTQHITQSLATIAKYGRGFAAAPDFKGAIGVNKGRVEGCDIYTGKLDFSMTKQIPSISLAYVKTLRNLTGTVNNATFYSHDAGELLFLGASGQTTGTPDAGGWTVTFDFAEAENLEPGDPRLVIVPDSGTEGDGLVISAGKEGWDYVWVYYEPQTTENQLGLVPLAAYVEQVYPRSSFSLLGIG